MPHVKIGAEGINHNQYGFQEGRGLGFRFNMRGLSSQRLAVDILCQVFSNPAVTELEGLPGL
jgi:hypothetical protein